MSFFKPVFITYQDVKTNLAKWSVPIWGLFVILIWRVVLHDSHRTWLLEQFPYWEEWARNLGAITVAFILGGGLAQLLVHIVEIHDHIYDKYIVKWRKKYVLESIIPELLKPVLNRLPANALEVSRQNWKLCMKRLFYYFATDYEPKINQNLLVRFYERVTKYWLSQLAEVSLIMLAILTVAYGILEYLIWGLDFPIRLLWLVLIVIVIFIVVKRISITLRRTVWDATKDEIEAIISHRDFKKRMTKFSEEVGLKLNA